MAALTASDVLVETLMDWEVDTVFGLPGDGINGIIEALRVRQDRIKFIQVRHEEAAGFMASAYAKYTGKLGCCLATSGPGGIHLLNGLYDAKLAVDIILKFVIVAVEMIFGYIQQHRNISTEIFDII